MPLLATDPRPCSVYRWYAPGGQLLYVGCSVDPERRWDQISLDERWPRYAATRTIEWHGTVELARNAERDAIKTESPLLNLNGQMKGMPAKSEIWRELRLPDGAKVPFLRAPHVTRWLVGDDEIVEFFEAVESGRPLDYRASQIGTPIAPGWWMSAA